MSRTPKTRGSEPPPPARTGRAASFGAIGALLSLGAPLGLGLTRAAVHGDATPMGLAGDLAAEAATYAYVTLSTLVAFTVAGTFAGRVADRLAETSRTDPLTGLANRRALSERLEEEVGRAARYGFPVALLLVDVDHLKRINDGAGHEAGDRALRLVAEAVSHTCRQTDVAERWGGDDFAVLAPGVGAAEAGALAERLRVTLSTLGEEPRPTVSVGVADLAGSGASSAAALRAAADEALYLAKDRGRDRVELAGRSG
ncbi:MAG: GGDEF domain-containing protein [Deltaproteobacteria bacterium]|nr:GGDEF domain-containing protein [Deltaproteobacteria bacterium]